MEKDVISRQAVLDALDKHCDIVCQYSKKQRSAMCGACPLGTAFDVMEELPSAQQERKKGRWLPYNLCGDGYWVCSSCKNPTEAFAADVLYKYCPFCGADMRGEQNDSV